MNPKPNLHFVNLLGHACTILDVHGETVLSIPGNKETAILQHTYRTSAGEWLGHIPLKDLTITPMCQDGYSLVTRPFPTPQLGVAYIVPANVAGYLLSVGRTDVYAPGPIIRQDGRIKGCVGLARHKGSE